MPRRRRGGPRPGGPHKVEWIKNDEKERSLEEIGERLKAIGEFLATRGTVNLNGAVVRPPDPCWFLLRYEHDLDEGILRLKLELEWDEPSSVEASAEALSEEVVIS